MQCQQRPEEDCGYLGTRVTDSCAPACGLQGTELGNSAEAVCASKLLSHLSSLSLRKKKERKNERKNENDTSTPSSSSSKTHGYSLSRKKDSGQVPADGALIRTELSRSPKKTGLIAATAKGHPGRQKATMF